MQDRFRPTKTAGGGTASERRRLPQRGFQRDESDDCQRCHGVSGSVSLDLIFPVELLLNHRLFISRDRRRPRRILLPLPHFVRVVRRHRLLHDRDRGANRVSLRRSDI